jgi:hypothetical protein
VFEEYYLYINTYLLYNVGDRTEPCSYISLGVGISPSAETPNFLWERKEIMSLTRLIENFSLYNLRTKKMCHMELNAFSISKTTAAVDTFLLNLNVTWCNVGKPQTWRVVLWRARKTNWLALMCLWTVFRITFSNSLPVVGKRVVGRKFWRNFGSLTGFSNVIAFASFLGTGRWASGRTSGLLGRRLGLSFGIL